MWFIVNTSIVSCMIHPDEGTDLGELFHTAFRSLRRTWSEQLAPWELTPHQWRALLMLMRRHPDVPTHPLGAANDDDSLNTGERKTGGTQGFGAGDVRLKDLAERLRIAPRSATEVVDQLEAKALVCRTPDPTDRRATLIVATAAGARLFADIQAERRDKSSEYFSRLDARDRAELARILRLLHD